MPRQREGVHPDGQRKIPRLVSEIDRNRTFIPPGFPIGGTVNPHPETLHIVFRDRTGIAAVENRVGIPSHLRKLLPAARPHHLVRRKTLRLHITHDRNRNIGCREAMISATQIGNPHADPLFIFDRQHEHLKTLVFVTRHPYRETPRRARRKRGARTHLLGRTRLADAPAHILSRRPAISAESRQRDPAPRLRPSAEHQVGQDDLAHILIRPAGIRGNFSSGKELHPSRNKVVRRNLFAAYRKSGDLRTRGGVPIRKRHPVAVGGERNRIMARHRTAGIRPGGRTGGDPKRILRRSKGIVDKIEHQIIVFRPIFYRPRNRQASGRRR